MPVQISINVEWVERGTTRELESALVVARVHAREMARELGAHVRLCEEGKQVAYYAPYPDELIRKLRERGQEKLAQALEANPSAAEELVVFLRREEGQGEPAKPRERWCERCGQEHA